MFDGGAGGGESRPLPDEMFDCIAAAIDERGVTGTPRQCLEPESPGPRKEIEHACTRQFRPEPIEQCDPRTVRRRPDGWAGHL